MLTGRQIRAARSLLQLKCGKLACEVDRMSTPIIMRAEQNRDETLSGYHRAVIRHTLERLGVEFMEGDVRLRDAARVETAA